MRDIKIWICIDIYKVNSFYHFVWFNLDPVVLLAFFFLFLYCFWRNCELVRTGLLCASCYYVNSSVISVSNLSWGSLKISTSALFKYFSWLDMCGSLKVNLLWHCIITPDPDYECFSSVQFRPLLVDTSSPFQNWNIVLSGFFICISIRIFHTCSLGNRITGPILSSTRYSASPNKSCMCIVAELSEDPSMNLALRKQ